MEPRKDTDIPEGRKFLELVWKQEDQCELETDTRLPTMGEKAPACLERLGTIFSLLDRMASCWWVCRKGDHLVEYLCGRVEATGRASMRLMRFGLYDEALSLCRGIGEIANLLCLFHRESSAFGEWKRASRRERLQDFGPARIRLRLQNLGTQVPISQERYTLLSERAVHVHPGTKPQAHNILGIPLAGAALQDDGLLVCLNELAVGSSLSTVFGALLLDFEKDLKRRIIDSAVRLAEAIGRATITEIDDYYREVLADPNARDRVGQIAANLRRLQDDERQ